MDDSEEYELPKEYLNCFLTDKRREYDLFETPEGRITKINICSEEEF